MFLLFMIFQNINSICADACNLDTKKNVGGCMDVKNETWKPVHVLVKKKEIRKINGFMNISRPCMFLLFPDYKSKLEERQVIALSMRQTWSTTVSMRQTWRPPKYGKVGLSLWHRHRHALLCKLPIKLIRAMCQLCKNE